MNQTDPWVTLAQLKADLKIDPTDTRDDVALQQMLDAAVAFVERVHRGHFDFDGDPLVDLPAPDADIVLGTIRLAGRYKTRSKSPDGLVDMGELGSSRVPSFDPDIERLLRIGRHAKPVVG